MDTLTNGHQPAAATPAPEERIIPLTQARAAGRRLSQDETRGLGGFGLQVIIPPPGEDKDWSMEALGRDAFRNLKPAQLVARLVRLSPEFGRATFDYLRMANPGWEAKAYRAGSDDAPDTRAQAAVDAFMDHLADRHGSADVPINRLMVGMWLRGACFVELVMDRAGRMPIDLATPDPYSVRFRLDDDPEYGQVWTLGQRQNGVFVPLDRETVRYVPVDPLPGNPYGVAPAGPGLFPAVFLLTFLHVLQRVVAQQGMPRLDIRILTERLLQVLPPNQRTNPTVVQEFVTTAVDAVANAYAKLEPDQAYVHTDDIEMGQPIGTVGDDLLGGVGGIVETIERMNVRGLKTMPLLFGITDAVSEANANRQWEIHAAGIKAIQHLAETPLSRLLTLALEAQGIAANVEFRFSELRSAEELRDAQTLNQKLVNAQLLEALGYESHEGAGLYATAMSRRRMRSQSRRKPSRRTTQRTLRRATPRTSIRSQGRIGETCSRRFALRLIRWAMPRQATFPRPWRSRSVTFPMRWRRGMKPCRSGPGCSMPRWSIGMHPRDRVALLRGAASLPLSVRAGCAGFARSGAAARLPRHPDDERRDAGAQPRERRPERRPVGASGASAAEAGVRGRVRIGGRRAHDGWASRLGHGGWVALRAVPLSARVRPGRGRRHDE